MTLAKTAGVRTAMTVVARKSFQASRPFLAPKPLVKPRPFPAPKPWLAAVALVGLSLTACAPRATTGHTTVADDVQFDYSLAPTPRPHTFHVALNLADPKSGAPIRDANVAVSVFGPGYDGAELINLRRGEAGGYDGDLVMPKPATYNLTFQVNRAAEPSASAVFAAQPPAQVASTAPAGR